MYNLAVSIRKAYMPTLTHNQKLCLYLMIQNAQVKRLSATALKKELNKLCSDSDLKQAVAFFC